MTQWQLIKSACFPGSGARLFYDQDNDKFKVETTIDGNFVGPGIEFNESELGLDKDLTMAAFDDANYTRCNEAFHPIDSWSHTDWACATAGEIGEACNWIKKMRRVETESGFARRVEKDDYGDLPLNAAIEYVDAITYCFLAIRRLGFDPTELLIDKFNQVSDRVGSKIRI